MAECVVRDAVFNPKWEPTLDWQEPALRELREKKDELEARRVELQDATYQTLMPERTVSTCTHCKVASRQSPRMAMDTVGRC